MQDDQCSLGRRSPGAKKNVTTYKVDFSDDSDLDDFAVGKWGKFESGAEDEVKSENEGEEVSQKQSNNSMNGKSVPNDSNSMKQVVGAKSGEELDGSRHVKDKTRCSEGGAAKKDPHKNSNFVETSMRSDSIARDSTLHGELHCTPGVTRRVMGGKSSQQAESPSPRLKTMKTHVTEQVTTTSGMKSVPSLDTKLLSKSQSTSEIE